MAQDKDGPFPLKSSPLTEPASKGAPDLREIEFQRIRRKNDATTGPKEAKHVVIKSWDDYDRFLGNQKEEHPQVDFTTEELIGVSMGEQTSNGYAIEIVRIRHGAGFGLIGTYVEYVETKPTPGQAQEDVMTYPVDIVKVKKLEGETKFTKLESKPAAA